MKGMKPEFDSIPSVLSDLRKGRMVIVVDDADRENEGDLIMAAQFVTPAAINFMAKHGRGLICVPTTSERLQQLGIERMVHAEPREFSDGFPGERGRRARGHHGHQRRRPRARRSGSWPIPPRCRRTWCSRATCSRCGRSPGGVLQRAGHTEAAVDLVTLAGCRPIGVICEIMSDDGSMARLPELVRFASKHRLKICTIADLIQYRRDAREAGGARGGGEAPDGLRGLRSVPLPLEDWTASITWRWCAGSGGEAKRAGARPQRMFDGRRVRVAPLRLRAAIAPGHAAGGGGGRGVVVYMRQEGRGIGLAPKIKAYKLQEHGYDTVEANLKLGYGMDLREYGLGAQILVDLGLKTIRLLTNNPRKVVGPGRLRPGNRRAGADQGRGPIRTTQQYLKTKREKMGHLL